MQGGAVAELVVQNGRQAGTRQPLSTPLTFIGRAPGCELRLNVDGIQPLHCLLAFGPQGVLVRDLETAAGTFVNGQRIHSCPLQDNDVLALGALQIRVSLPPGTAQVAAASDVEAERDAVRVQTAAVAAQQAALLEQESRLLQQQGALTQQQEQVASHLEEKHQRLEQLAGETQAARAALKREQDEQAQTLSAQQGDLAATLAELEAERQQLQAERQQMQDLRRQYQQRFKKRCADEREHLREREAEISAHLQHVAGQRQQQEQDRAKWTQTRLEQNGDLELSKRQLREEWQKLWAAQHQGNDHRAQQQAALAARARTLRAREDTFSDAERALADDQFQWGQKRKVAEAEVYGLESRINNQRRRLLEIQRELRQVESRLKQVNSEDTPVVAVLVEEVPNSSPVLRGPDEKAAALARVADDLADQRLLLLEHWQRLVAAQQQWHQAHGAAVDHLQALTASLPQQEQALIERQKVVEAAESALHRRQCELSQLRQHLEGWAARVQLKETTWESERDQLLIAMRAREASAEKHVQKSVDLRQRWTKRRKNELDLLREERKTCEQLRQEYAAIRQECWKRGLALHEQQREAAEKSLALEEYRQRFVLRSQDAAAVEARLDRIRRRWVQENALLMRSNEEQIERLQTESSHLQQRGRELLKVAEDLAGREASLAQRQIAWEEQLTLSETQQAKLRQELDSVKGQRARADQQVAELQSEVERIARVLLDEVDVPELPLARAA